MPIVVIDQIGYQLKRAQQALRTAMDEALRDVGLTTAQYAALSTLEDMPGASSAALARACFVTAQTMNEIVASLQAAGLIRRQPHPEHGRILQAYLTEQGQARVTQAHALVRLVGERMVAGLSPQERDQFLQWLRRCSEALETHS
jgi:DNA-binding MarR family transcriptional regulator